MRAGALLIAACLPACASGDGEPFGAVTATLDARWTERADRANGDWQRLASDFEVQVSAASMELGALALIDVGGVALNFDPAEPPPGYSLCHGGHCHADDGRLVPYAEVAAELAGGAPPAPVLVLPVGDRELVPGGEIELDCDGPCDLPRARIGRVELPVAGVKLAGLVRDTREPPRLDGELAWTLTYARGDDAAALLGATDLPVDRGEDPAITLTVGLAPSAALLDGVRFAEAAGAAAPWDADGDPQSLVGLEDALVELALAPTVTRH